MLRALPAYLVPQRWKPGQSPREVSLPLTGNPVIFYPLHFQKRSLILSVTGLRSGPFPEQPCRLAVGPRCGGEQAGEWDLLQAGPHLPGRLAAWEQEGSRKGGTRGVGSSPRRILTDAR